MSPVVVVDGDNVSNIGFWNCTFTSSKPQDVAVKIKAGSWVSIVGGSVQGGGIDIEADEHVFIGMVDMKASPTNPLHPDPAISPIFPTSLKSTLKSSCAASCWSIEKKV